MQNPLNTQPAAAEQIASQARRLRSQLDELENDAAYKVRRAARAADLSIQSHPYRAIGLAAALGLLIGVIVARR